MPITEKELEDMDKTESHGLDNWYGFPAGPNSVGNAIIAAIIVIGAVVGISFLFRLF